MHTQHQKKKEEQKGFDLLEATFLEKGLVAAGSAHSMGLKAVGDTHAHQNKHHLEKEKARKHRAEFTKSAGNRANAKRTNLANLIPVKTTQKRRYGILPPQSKKPDVDEPKNGKKK